MAAGTPIVASATADIADIIVDGTSGCLVPVGDAQALSETIKQVLADRQSSRQMANKAQQLVRQEYKLESMIARTAQLYERCWAER
jgi:glycosyltransferase involved in cell wall biosynthesis